MKYREIKKEELDEILRKHKLWLNSQPGGEKADLSYADLSYADLSSANLRFADLSYANLSFADLSFADLSSANLRFANLSAADLSSANLSAADLSYANLSSANLLIFQFRKNTAYFTLDGTLRIGCHVMPISEWVIGYKEIGESEGYSAAEIEAYGDFIKLCAKQFEMEAKK